MDIWGVCDWRVEQVVNAWNAVGVSSANGILYDGQVNCTDVTSLPGFPYYQKAIHNLSSNCTYTYEAELNAGNEISLLPGTDISFNNGNTSQFKAHILPCLRNNRKGRSPYPTNYGGKGAEMAKIEEGNEPETNVELSNEIKVFPNPAEDNITVSFGDMEWERIEIYNMQGISIRSLENIDSSTSLSINLEKIPSGVYMLVVNSGERSVTQQIIKK